ncbi:MAG: DUF5060 domain-containing protein [Armatimonadetes bacterium]|nr:DUF5060 domain-containing protein [Armatimonadota bacterium]
MNRRRFLVCVGLIAASAGCCLPAPAPYMRHLRRFQKMEVRFQPPPVTGNPFDYRQVDIRAVVSVPDGNTCRVPAFYDGEKGWKVRFTALRAGRHRWRFTLNGKPFRPGTMQTVLSPYEAMHRGFVRRRGREFVFDSGARYYPLGHNQGWQTETGPIPALLEAMGRAGENWSRIWMCHWDGKNLDWLSGEAMAKRHLSLEAARRWDEIVEAAERSGLRLQVALQHHGPYSTTTDSNWRENPWNRANGGFLAAPEEFFTHPEALERTRMKYRYILARWGYSPAVMAWELWNEVQWTDAARKDWEKVARWHDDMAAFLRREDPFKHLITSSSMEPGHRQYRNLDYAQPHVYTADIISHFRRGAGSLLKSGKPAFYGEWGPSGRSLWDTRFLHQGLWAGIMTPASGAPGWWAWDRLTPEEMLRHFRPVSLLLAQSGLASRPFLKIAPLKVLAEGQAPLILSPQGGWSASRTDTVVLEPGGENREAAALPLFFQGKFHREMHPEAVRFLVRYAQPGFFKIRVGTVARAGAFPRLSLDGQEMHPEVDGKPSDAWQGYPPAVRDTRVSQTLAVPVPAGKHTVTLRNTGDDWFALEEIRLEPYAPALSALALADSRYMAGWIYHRGRLDPEDVSGQPAAEGRIEITGLRPGPYRLVWWDTAKGRVIGRQTVKIAGPKTLISVPRFRRDIAFWMIAARWR